jgi:GNAT superfamily N-acetyltransferase
MTLIEPVTLRQATTLKQATPEDLDAILRLRDEAARWMAAIGSDQWQSAWPTPDQKTEQIAESIKARETWMLWIGDSRAGTVAVDEYSDPALWQPAEQVEPAYYVHRLIIARSHGGKGLGAAILNWCCDWAARNGKQWVRIDVWTTNCRLQEYYLNQQFEHVRTIHSEYPSGALFQRSAGITDAEQLPIMVPKRSLGLGNPAMRQKVRSH